MSSGPGKKGENKPWEGISRDQGESWFGGLEEFQRRGATGARGPRRQRGEGGRERSPRPGKAGLCWP